MENVLGGDLAGLLQAVGDPLQYPDIPLQDGRPVVYYDPTIATAILIEFASSDLWRDHLRCSNFTSYEEIVSTMEGKRTALNRILDLAASQLFEFLHTPAKIIMAVRCLKELECWNTAEVVILWAWTFGVVDPSDHDGWKLIERETLLFYQTHGMEHLATLKRHIVDVPTDGSHTTFLAEHYEGSPFRVGNIKLLARASKYQPWEYSWEVECSTTSRACQWRMLYGLFGCDPTTWEEAVTVKKVDGDLGISSRHSVTPAPLIDWACDYP